MKLLRKVTNIFDRTILILAVLAAIIIAFIMLSVGTDVVMRYFLGRTMPWLFETTEYSLLFITFLGTAWVLRREGHVKMDIVLTRLDPRTQSLLNGITYILGAIVFFIVAWYGVKVTWGMFQVGYRYYTVLSPPRFIILAVIPLGSCLLSILLLRRAYGYLGNWTASRGQEKRLRQSPKVEL